MDSIKAPAGKVKNETSLPKDKPAFNPTSQLACSAQTLPWGSKARSKWNKATRGRILSGGTNPQKKKNTIRGKFKGKNANEAGSAVIQKRSKAANCP